MPDMRDIQVDGDAVRDELDTIMGRLHLREPVTSDELATFCQLLTDYILISIVKLENNQHTNIAINFCSQYAKNQINSIPTLKDDLAALYISLQSRKFLENDIIASLTAESKPTANTSTHHHNH